LQQLQLLLFRSKQNKKGLENSLYRANGQPTQWALGRPGNKKKTGWRGAQKNFPGQPGQPKHFLVPDSKKIIWDRRKHKKPWLGGPVRKTKVYLGTCIF